MIVFGYLSLVDLKYYNQFLVRVFAWYANSPNIVVKFNNIINNNINTNDVKYAQLKDEIEVLDDRLNFRNDDLTFLKKTILKTEFYKDILMNSSSHDDTQKEFYTKEFQKSIKILEKLKKILKNLK